MSSSSRRGGSGKGGGKHAASAEDNRRRAASFCPATVTAATTTGAGRGAGSHGGAVCGGSPSRLGHNVKYRKPKVGLAFQCVVPKFVPPGGGGEHGDNDGSASASGSAGGRTATTTATTTTRGGGSGRRSGGGARARGKGGGKGGRARGGARGGGSRGGGGGASSAGTSFEAVAESLASGESSIDVANAAAERLRDNYGSSLRAIPRGGLCVHRPLWRRHEDDGPTSPLMASAGGSTRLTSPPADLQEDYLAFARNVFLQTPRSHSEMTIDQIWDGPTAEKFKADELALPTTPGRGGRVRGKRKAAAMSLDIDVDDNHHVASSVPPFPAKPAPAEDSAVGDKGGKTSAPDFDPSPSRTGEKSAGKDEETEFLPLCGLEDDERALSYLQANYHGDLEKAKLSIMVDSDRGYGVQRRRQLKKKRKEVNEAYPDATTFSSESWRWRVHQARPTMLGDFRSSRDPTYPYFDPAPIEINELLDTSLPWRLRRFGQDVSDDVEADERRPTRPRSFSISWSEEEIEMAKKIWKSILAYTKGILGKIDKIRKNDAKPPLCDLLELASKAHALPTPEEAFGRRDPSARQMSENMNSIIDAIEGGRDCVARILKCLKDDGEGIELDTLRKSIDNIEQSCPVGLTELDTVKRQVQEATLWEEKLENNVDHGTADSDASDGEDVITEKKLTLEKVERLVSKGRNLTLRPRSLVRLQSRIERAHILRRRIHVWNEARTSENPQNIKFVSTLIKQANKIDLAFPELFTLTGVHKKAEEWIDRASIAVRTTISFEELESLVSVGESLPLNVSDVLEKLQNRLKQAREWMARLEEIVPKSECHLMWLRRFRDALEDEEKNAHLLSLLSEGSRIPVTMECSILLQIEIDARNWTGKAKMWIPQNLDRSGEVGVPQKRGKIDDVKDHLDRASSLRDRLWFGEAEKMEWVLDGETQLAKMVEMAETWLNKHHDVLNYDSRRNGKLCLPMLKLHAIVEEVNQIPLNIGNASTKMNRMFSQADEWMKKHYQLVKRCGVECSYAPACVESASDNSPKALKMSELSSAVADADSNVSVDLDVVTTMKELLERAQIWIRQANAVVPKKDSRKKGKQEKHSIKEISDLIDESTTIVVDITDELERLKLEQSTTLSWRLQVQQTLRQLVTAFNNFRKERSDVCSIAAESNSSTSETLPTTSTAGPTAVANNIISVSMTTRNINSRRRALSSAGTSGSETPAYAENGGKYLFPLLSSFLKSVKSMNTVTPEGSVSDELYEVTSWFTKTFKLMNNPSDVYDRRNFSKLDKLVESGQKLVNLDSLMAEEIPEDKKLVDDLRRSWAAAVNDDIERLMDLQNQRNKFVDWCEKADAIVSSTDKKVSIDTLKELLDQSASYPSSSEIVLRVRKRAKDAIAWVSSLEEIIKTGKKIPLEEAKLMTDVGDKLNISCPEYKTMRAALRATRGWLSRVKKCGAANGQHQVAGNLVTELINEHNTFFVTAMDAFTELKQVMCGYCVCRQPYEGFMIGCDGCEEWYHGPCVGISQEQAQKFDKYVCVRCSTLRVYKDNAATVAGILRKWMSAKGLVKARSGDSQRYGRKVRSAERDIVKAKADLEKYERELNTLLGLTSDATPQVNVAAAAINALSQSQSSSSSVSSQVVTNGKVAKSEKALRDKIGKAHTTIGNCEKRLEGYKVELVERKSLEAREDALALNLKKWCATVKHEVFSPVSREKAELSRPRSDGSMSDPMDRAKKYAETLGIAKLPDIDAVLNSFKIFSWCLHSLGILMRKPRIDEIRTLLSHSDSGYFKLPEAKCVRMLRSMSSRAQIWQSKARKALAPTPNVATPYDLAMLRELLLASKQIPLTMAEETRLWSTIEDGGNRHCICGGPSDGSFMLGCDNCDRWFHGSCMKIDKETGDALSKWICPPCSKSVSVDSVKIQENHTTTGDEKLSQETNCPQSIQPPLAQPYHDISPHAPNPTCLWPPFGLRSTKEAAEALGKVGESDNEDFEVPKQPIARVKSDSNAYPQKHVPQGAPANSSTMTNVSQFPLCQPISAVDSGSNGYPQSNVPQVASKSAAPSVSRALAFQTKAGNTQTAQQVAPTNGPSVSRSHTHQTQARNQTAQIFPPQNGPNVSRVPTHLTQVGNAQTARKIAPNRAPSISQRPTFQIQAGNAQRSQVAHKHAPSVPRAATYQTQIGNAHTVQRVAHKNAPGVSRAPAYQTQAGNTQTTQRFAYISAPSSRVPTYHTQAGQAQTAQRVAQRVAHKSSGVFSNSRPVAPKTNHQPIASTQMPFSQYSSGSNVRSTTTPFTSSATAHHTASYHSEQTNRINSMGLGGPNLSVAVANMDHYVLSAGDGAGLQHISNTPVPGVAMGSTAPMPTNPAMQVGVPKGATMKGTNCQPYTTASFPQATPKAP